MSDLLTSRIANAKGRARVRVSQSERQDVIATRAASRAALAGAIESRAVAHYERTVQRMQSLLTEKTYLVESLARHREAGCWTRCDAPLHEALDVNTTELAAVFGTPIRQTDCAPGGRFERYVAYHMRRIASRHTIGSMLITGDDARDILSLALVRAYTDGALVEDERGNAVPTLGTLYRFSRAELVRAVSRARREVSTVSRDAEWYSDREEIPRNGAASLYGVDPSRIDWTDRDAVKAILTPAPRWAVTPDATDQALAERLAHRRAKAARAEAKAHAAARTTDRIESAERAAFGDDDALGIDAACVSLLASGTAPAAIADRLGILPDTLTRRLASVRIVPNGKGFRAARIGSDGRTRRAAVKSSGRDNRLPEARDLIVTRKRVIRPAVVVPFDAVRLSLRLAETPSPVPNYGAELESAIESGDERIIALSAAVKDATASLHATDAGAHANVTSPAGAIDWHRAAHVQGRCNCDAAA